MLWKNLEENEELLVSILMFLGHNIISYNVLEISHPKVTITYPFLEEVIHLNFRFLISEIFWN